MKLTAGLVMALVAFSGICWHGDGSAQGIKMTVGQTGINPGTSLYFIAQKEKLYAKHGLDPDIVNTSTSAAVQAMVGGSMHLATGAGAAAFVTATLEGAPPFALVSSWVNVFPYKLMAHKDISKPEDLRGKTGQVGAPFGTIPDTALRFALSKLGLNPEKDVKLVQLPRPDAAQIIAQMEKGEVYFGVLAPPFDRIAEMKGFRPLISLPELGIPWQQNGEWVPRSYLKTNRDNVLRFVRAMSDAIKFYFEHKDKTITYLMEFLGSNREDTQYGYETFARWVDRNPRPRAESIRTTLEAIKKTSPKAASADPASFIDASIVEQLAKEGYFK